ncbi:MAG: HipA domain-containing protein [Burkholderiales bacterium]
MSVPTLHRILAEAGPHVLTAGKARRARYALRRPLRGAAADLTVYEIDVAGHVTQVGTLVTVYPSGSWLDLAAMGWPHPDDSRDGWWNGLPYPCHDMRPQGYMGRQFARAEHRRLGVPADPNAWSDDDVLVVLSRSGIDASGSLILGDLAVEQWTAARLTSPAPRRARWPPPTWPSRTRPSPPALVQRCRRVPEVHGAARVRGSRTLHVIVKFSGADGSAAVTFAGPIFAQEHLALEAAATMPGIESARSRIIQAAGRTFLEVERFDRHDRFGRSRLSSLETLNGALLGAMTTEWPALAERLAALSLLSAEDVERVRHLWWYGRLIANTDMHLGNLGFRPAGILRLAPTYDMVPMLYAPLAGGEVPPRHCSNCCFPARPTPGLADGVFGSDRVLVGRSRGFGASSEGFRCHVRGQRRASGTRPAGHLAQDPGDVTRGVDSPERPRIPG